MSLYIVWLCYHVCASVPKWLIPTENTSIYIITAVFIQYLYYKYDGKSPPVCKALMH